MGRENNDEKTKDNSATWLYMAGSALAGIMVGFAGGMLLGERNRSEIEKKSTYTNKFSAKELGITTENHKPTIEGIVSGSWNAKDLNNDGTIELYKTLSGFTTTNIPLMQFVDKKTGRVYARPFYLEKTKEGRINIQYLDRKKYAGGNK